MKISNYNIHFTHQQYIVLYNSLSDNFVLLKPILFDLLMESSYEDRIKDVKNIAGQLYNSLINNGFVVPKDKNELAEVKLISEQTDFDESHYELTINPTMNCNFKCWYCYETHIKDSKMSEITENQIKLFVENIFQEKKNVLKTFYLNWFGGEPLLYFQKTILPLLKWIYPKTQEHNIQFKSSFTSNGLLITQTMLDECKKYNVQNFQITLDGHRNRHNKVRYISKNKGSYDKIVENIKLCAKNKFSVTVRINVSEETLSELLDIIPDFEDLNSTEKQYLSFSFHKVWQEEKELEADLSAIVKQYRQHGLTTSYLGEHVASIRHSCYADKLNQATINYNGEVFKCTARDYISDNREGVLTENGTIDWNSNFYERMFKTRFKNKPCLSCKILPLCNGGCSQHRLEHKNISYCVYNFDENAKMNIVKEKFNTRMHYENSKIIELP